MYYEIYAHKKVSCKVHTIVHIFKTKSTRVQVGTSALTIFVYMELLRNFQNDHHSVGNFIPIEDGLFCPSLLNYQIIVLLFFLELMFFFHIHTFVNEKKMKL